VFEVFKKYLVEIGIVEFYLSVLSSNEYSYVHDGSVTGLWNLSLDSNLLQILLQKGVKEGLENVCISSTNQDAKNIAKSVLDSVFSN